MSATGAPDVDGRGAQDVADAGAAAGAATAAARRKGRVQEGADADLVVFDPGNTIEDKATYRAAGAPSVGVRYLLADGTLVVAEGRIVEGVAPGRPLSSDAARR